MLHFEYRKSKAWTGASLRDSPYRWTSVYVQVPRHCLHVNIHQKYQRVFVFQCNTQFRPAFIWAQSKKNFNPTFPTHLITKLSCSIYIYKHPKKVMSCVEHILSISLRYDSPILHRSIWIGGLLFVSTQENLIHSRKFSWLLQKICDKRILA